MRPAELSVELFRAGFAIPAISVELWRRKERRRVKLWLAYRNRERRARGRPAQYPDFLNRYKVCALEGARGREGSDQAQCAQQIRREKN